MLSKFDWEIRESTDSVILHPGGFFRLKMHLKLFFQFWPQQMVVVQLSVSELWAPVIYSSLMLADVSDSLETHMNKSAFQLLSA